MSADERTSPERDERPESDDIEILEVVGIDADDDRSPADPDAESAIEDADEIELVFDEGRDDLAGGPSEPAAGHGRETVDREQFLRLHADFENFRKRSRREMEDTVERANAQLLSRLLPILDNLERALAAPATDGNDGLREGVALIYRQIVDELRKEGLHAIEAVGRTFDPSLHEAVSTDSSGTHPPNTVVQEMQRGYLFRDRLLRPALVSVAVENGAGDEQGASEN